MEAFHRDHRGKVRARRGEDGNVEGEGSVERIGDGAHRGSTTVYESDSSGESVYEGGRGKERKNSSVVAGSTTAFTIDNILGKREKRKKRKKDVAGVRLDTNCPEGGREEEQEEEEQQEEEEEEEERVEGSQFIGSNVVSATNSGKIFFTFPITINPLPYFYIFLLPLERVNCLVINFSIVEIVIIFLFIVEGCYLLFNRFNRFISSGRILLHGCDHPRLPGSRLLGDVPRFRVHLVQQLVRAVETWPTFRPAR